MQRKCGIMVVMALKRKVALIDLSTLRGIDKYTVKETLIAPFYALFM
jgi:hypothetical protein